MPDGKLKILVIFVEPMLYGFDLIHEVYEKTQHEFKYVYCHNKLTGKDELKLPENSYICAENGRAAKTQITDTLKEFAPDFVIINGYIGAVQTAAIRYCQKKRIPYAIESDTPLNVPSSMVKAMAKKAFLRRLLHHPVCYGFPGGTLQKENLVYYGISENKNFIMPMSVSENRLVAAGESLPDKDELKKTIGIVNKRTFLFVGRLAPEKHVDLLIDAYAALKKNESDISLLIVGDGSEAEMLKKKTADLNLEDVHFMGYVLFPEIVRYYKMADVFVLPSVYEPWGLVVNEAMIMGIPVIVSDKVGCRTDLVIEGKNGFIFSNCNADDLAKKMKSFSDKVIGRFSEWSRKRASEWNYTYYLKCFNEAIENIAEK